MISTQSLRDEMDRYTSGAVTIEALEEWLASESWDMRRYAPKGLQSFVEALQAAFIDYSDRKISETELQRILIQRREQLERAAKVTAQIDVERRALADAIDKARKAPETVAGSQAVMITELASQ